jgi:hypothetical protein
MVYFLIGIVLLASAVASVYSAMPRNGQLTAVGRNYVLGEFFTLGVVAVFVLGIAFLMVAVLT